MEEIYIGSILLMIDDRPTPLRKRADPLSGPEGRWLAKVASIVARCSAYLRHNVNEHRPTSSHHGTRCPAQAGVRALPGKFASDQLVRVNEVHNSFVCSITTDPRAQSATEKTNLHLYNAPTRRTRQPAQAIPRRPFGPPFPSATTSEFLSNFNRHS